MNKELINLRIQDLIARGKQLEQELQQINGALQQCQWTLSELEKSDDETRQADSAQDNG
jgi:chaperonin cofactor prefoldin